MINKLMKEILENNNIVQNLKEKLNMSMHFNNKKRSKITEALNSSSVRVSNRPLKRMLQLQELQVKQYVLYFQFQAFLEKGLAFYFLRFPLGDALGARNTITASFHATLWNTPEFSRIVVVFLMRLQRTLNGSTEGLGVSLRSCVKSFLDFFLFLFMSDAPQLLLLGQRCCPTAGKCHGPSWPWRVCSFFLLSQSQC